MNIILNTALPTSLVSKKEYDNKILYTFLIFMVALVLLGLFFLDFSKSFAKEEEPFNNDDSSNLPPQIPLYV